MVDQVTGKRRAFLLRYASRLAGEYLLADADGAEMDDMSDEEDAVVRTEIRRIAARLVARSTAKAGR